MPADYPERPGGDNVKLSHTTHAAGCDKYRIHHSPSDGFEDLDSKDAYA